MSFKLITSYKYNISPKLESKVIIRNTSLFSFGNGGTPYYERGWTYQELEMSQRKLFILQQELHWECGRSVWHEELAEGEEIDKNVNSCLRVISTGFPYSDAGPSF